MTLRGSVVLRPWALFAVRTLLLRWRRRDRLYQRNSNRVAISGKLVSHFFQKAPLISMVAS
jgi:hypothetical protein